MTSPSKSKRQSLNDIFPDLSIEHHSSCRSSSPQKRARMMSSMRETISRGWPSASSAPNPVFITIHSDGVYCQRANVQRPEELFEKTKNWLGVIQGAEFDEKKQDLITEEIHESMIRAIFGSNEIERVGLNLDITIHLCRQILSGKDVGVISVRTPEYQHDLAALYQRDPGLRKMPLQHILRSRSEVVQHARAFQHLIHAFVIEKQDLTECLIKETHKILVTGVPIIEPGYPDVEPEKYGGIYRTIPVSAGNTNFTVPKFVPAKMEEMCASLKHELDLAERNMVIDPFSTASKYSLEFVQIHPFMDGNGRMCRMILNAILCRYAGVVVPIGEQGEEREEYMQIKRDASEKMEGHGDYATFVLKKASKHIQKMKKKISGKGRSS